MAITSRCFAFWAVLCPFLLVFNHEAQARVVFMDGMEGMTAGYPLIYSTKDPQCSYSVTTNNPSPFTLPCLGVNTKSGLLADNSTTGNAVVTSNALGAITVRDWVHVSFDFRLVSGDEYKFVLSHTGGAPFNFLLNTSGEIAVTGRKTAGEPSRAYLIPGITRDTQSWYHVEVLLRPAAYSPAQRTYDVTVIQDTAGERRSGTVTGILQESAESITIFTCQDHTWNTANTGSIQLDNVLVETFTPMELAADGGFENPQAKRLSVTNASATAIYGATANFSPIADGPFTPNASASDFNDNDATKALGLSLDGIGAKTTDYVHAQFDFKPVSGALNQSSFLLQHGAASPPAFDLRFKGDKLAIYGRRAVTDAPSLIEVPNINVDADSWYRVDVLLRPTCLTAPERTFMVRITQFNGAEATVGEVADVLNEDSGAVENFRVSTGAAATTVRFYIDNLRIESLPQSFDDSAFRYAYLPSSHQIRYLVRGLAPVYAGGWDIKLLRAGDGRLVTHQAVRFLERSTSGQGMTIPALADGDYKLQLWLTGPNLNQLTSERTFTHTTYPWTNSKLGKDDILLPPFTPIAVNQTKKTVDTILRRHTISGAGLWSQVTSQGVDLLSGPVRLEVESGGAKYTAEGANAGFRFTKNTPTRANGEAKWSAGPIANATTQFDYDYDGMMKVTLKLPAAAQTIDSLKLVIPLKDSEAKYMHMAVDIVRDNISQSIPAGTGKVWDSAKVRRTNLPAPFVPYLWIGGAERGIAWFAENDKDWTVRPTDGVLELRRDAGEVALVVNLITVPSVLTRARTISFGLQATPTKPMPEFPENWRDWRYARCSGNLNFELMGSGYSWGQPVNCIQFYPAFKNFSIYDEYVKSRELGVNDGKVFVEKWLQQYPEDIPAENMRIYRAELGWGTQFMASRPKCEIKSAKVRDSMEGNATLPLALNGGDANCSYTTVGNDPSPFVSFTFAASKNSGLLVDNSAAANTSLVASGFGIAAGNWVNIQFDIRPVAGQFESWKYTAGKSTSAPFNCDVRIQGNRFVVYGRRSTTQAMGLLSIPNITVTAGDWYHIGIIATRADLKNDERRYDITITRQDKDGKRSYGTLYGILQEAATPIDVFRIGADAAATSKGQLQIDNVLVATVARYWVAPYTNARGINWADTLNHTGEVGTYLDEWSMIDIADPRWDDAIIGKNSEWRMLRENATPENYFSAAKGHGLFQSVWYDVDPVESMADMMLYYHQKMWENGMADGIYWDDFFLKANYNPVPGPGYVDDDGKLHAGVNIYAFRDLVKRAAVLQHAMGMRPLLWPHMTNANITPMLSFATMNLTLEWGTANLDLQDRFALDKDCAQVFTEITGFQTGNVGVILDLFYPKKDGISREHLLRTALAVALTHECKISAYDNLYFAVQDKLGSWGYGKPDCTVYRYWDGPQPVTADGAPVKMLVLKRPAGAANKAYAILGSFGEGGEARLKVDAAKLGLPDGYKVYDDETNAELAPAAPGEYHLNILKHEFKLVRLQ